MLASVETAGLLVPDRRSSLSSARALFTLSLSYSPFVLYSIFFFPPSHVQIQCFRTPSAQKNVFPLRRIKINSRYATPSAGSDRYVRTSSFKFQVASNERGTCSIWDVGTEKI